MVKTLNWPGFGLDIAPFPTTESRTQVVDDFFSEVHYALFLRKIKEIGKILLDYKNGLSHPKVNNQYMVTCLVSSSELKTGDTSFLEYVLFHISEHVPKIENIFECDRLKFFLNKNHKKGKKCRHTEKILLDPDNRIPQSENFQAEHYTAELFTESEHLSSMQEEFRKKFGDNEKSYLLIFSHYVPCTIKHHHCAELLGRYVDVTGQQVVVGYEKVFPETDFFKSIDSMKAIKVVHPQIQRLRL
ncbi:hypothetical protein ACF0H5_002681 [Mactra antiquata]